MLKAANKENVLFYFFLFIAVGTLLGSYYQRFIFSDDAWLGEQAYWLAKEGVVRSELFSGRNSYDIQKLIYHKLFIWQGSLVIQLLGWKVLHLKLISFLYLLGFIGVAYCYFKSSRQLKLFLPFIILLFSHNLIVQFSFFFRPEIMVMFLGFVSFIFLSKSIVTFSNHGKRNRWIFFSGFIAGLAMLGHLYGLIFIMAGGLILLFRKLWLAVLLFGLGAIIGFLPFFIDIIPNWKLFQTQLFNDFAVSNATDGFSFSIIYLLKKLLSEQMRFFHSEIEIAMTSVFLISLILGWKQIRASRLMRLHFDYLIITIVSLALIAHDKTFKYLVLYLPHILVIMAFVWKNIKYRWYKILMVIFLIVNWSFTIFRDYPKNYSQEKLQAEIVKEFQIPKASKVIAPIEFIFPNIESCTIKGLKFYEVLEKEGEDITANYIVKDALKYDYHYILLSENDLKKWKFPTLEKGDTFEQYRFEGEVDGFYLLKFYAQKEI